MNFLKIFSAAVLVLGASQMNAQKKGTATPKKEVPQQKKTGGQPYKVQ